MIVSNLKYFIDNCDFEMFSTWLANVDPLALLLNPFVLVPLIIIFGLIAYPKTTYIGQKLVLYVPGVTYLFVTGVILKNDAINNTGPFVMAMIAFFGVAGWLIWTQFLEN